jgi:hypothetical protein
VVHALKTDVVSGALQLHKVIIHDFNVANLARHSILVAHFQRFLLFLHLQLGPYNFVVDQPMLSGGLFAYAADGGASLWRDIVVVGESVVVGEEEVEGLRGCRRTSARVVVWWMRRKEWARLRSKFICVCK